MCVSQVSSMKSRSAIFCLLPAIMSLLLAGQAGGVEAIGMSNARATAMAGAYNGLALGAEAPFVNPANLSFKTSTPLSITIFGVGLQVANNSFNKAYYDRYNGAFLDQVAKRDILDAIPDKGLRMNSMSEAQALGVGYGQFAFSASMIGGAESTLARELFDLALNGNQQNRIYSFSPAAGEGIGLLSFAFSSGREIKIHLPYVNQAGIGVTLKYYRGLFYGQVLHARARALTEFSSVQAEGSANLRRSTGGNGFGLDFGATTTLYGKWRASFTVHNLLSTIRWNKQTEATLADFELFHTNLEQIDNFEGEVDSVFVSNDTTKAIGAFSTTLPTVLRLGVVRTFGSWLVTGEWEQGFKSSALSTTTPLLAVGSEYKPWRALRLRMGTSLGGRLGFTLTYGLGFLFGPVHWDFACVNYHGLIPSASRGFGFATSLSMRY
jgi:hypothetical protein